MNNIKWFMQSLAVHMCVLTPDVQSNNIQNAFNIAISF